MKFDQSIYRYHFKNWGLFSELTNLVDVLSLAEKHDFKILTDWPECLYVDPQREGPVWEYWFKPLFPELEHRSHEDVSEYPYGARQPDHLVRPTPVPGYAFPILMPRDRSLAQTLIERHIHLNAELQETLTSFKNRYLNEPFIGLHIRGPGRLDGGTKAQLRKLPLEEGVPFSSYFEVADRYLDEHPTAQVLVASDAELVIRKCIARYGDRLQTFAALRCEAGEFHEQNRAGSQTDFPGYQLGADALMDAYLLAGADFLVHGNSNMSNYILCLNADMPHHYIFKDVPVNWWYYRRRRDVRNWLNRITTNA